MIAVWLVEPPSRVASATTRVGSRPAVSAGARSSASRTDGVSGLVTPGSLCPVSSATIRSRTSLTSVTRSAMSPPRLVNSSANCWAAPTVATAAEAPASIRCSTVDSRPRSLASPAVVVSTAALTPLAAAARSVNRPATSSAAAANRARSPARSASATGSASSVGSCTAPCGRMTGPRATPGTTGVPVSTVGPPASVLVTSGWVVDIEDLSLELRGGRRGRDGGATRHGRGRTAGLAGRRPGGGR